MKTLSQAAGLKNQKRLILIGLYSFAAAILISGIFFIIYSQIYGIAFKVMNSSVPGFILGLIVAYFGVRGVLSVKKLQGELFKEDAVFSWANFKREKKAKSR